MPIPYNTCVAMTGHEADTTQVFDHRPVSLGAIRAALASHNAYTMYSLGAIRAALASHNAYTIYHRSSSQTSIPGGHSSSSGGASSGR